MREQKIQKRDREAGCGRERETLRKLKIGKGDREAGWRKERKA